MGTTKVKLDLIKESDFLIEETETDIYITGTKFIMPQFNKEVWSKKNLFLKAYELTLRENLMLPGKELVINTRFLKILQPTVLSVSGMNGEDYSVFANNGRHAGAHGENGQNGKPGEKAGKIKIFAEKIIGDQLTLKAIGGKGGGGQGGGNGAPGKAGGDAPDRSKKRSDEGGGRQGGVGGAGGNAGQGGAGGAGGEGGIVNICTGEEYNIVIEIDGGIGGQFGVNGNPGKGGPGGRGGYGVSCYNDGPNHQH